MISKKNSVSIVIPIYNEVENIFNLVNEILSEIDNFLEYEIIIINDCSTDNFLDEFSNYESRNYINLQNNKKNLGQSKSIYYGVEIAKFENIITLDGDGQNNPSDIKILCSKFFNENYSLVSGIRQKRKDSYLKKISSKLANFIRDLVLHDNCPDTGCGLKIFKKNVFLKIPYFNGIHRFIPAIFVNMKEKVCYIDVDHRYRKYGYSKYGTIGRMFKGIIDIIRVILIIRKLKND